LAHRTIERFISFDTHFVLIIVKPEFLLVRTFPAASITRINREFHIIIEELRRQTQSAYLRESVAVGAQGE
jgi:hypothetical protein